MVHEAEPLTEEETAELERLRFMARKFDAEYKYPIKISDFIESIQKAISLL